MKIILFYVLSLSVLFAFDSQKSNFSYQLQEGESFVYIKDDKFYKAYSTLPYTGKGITVDKEKVVKFDLVKGTINGTVELYNKEGALTAKLLFLNNKKNGLSQRWENGKKIQNLIYRDDEPYSGWTKNEYESLEYNDFQKTGWEISYKKTSNKQYTKEPSYFKLYYTNDKLVKTIAYDFYGLEIEKKEEKKESYAYSSNINNLILNMKDASGRGKLLKLSLSIQSNNKDINSLVVYKKATLVDIIISYLDTCSSEELMVTAGKAMFKNHLKQSFEKELNTNIHNIIFTNIIIK